MPLEGRREPGNWEQSWDVEIRLGIIRQSLETITEGRGKEKRPQECQQEDLVEAEKPTEEMVDPTIWEKENQEKGRLWEPRRQAESAAGRAFVGLSSRLVLVLGVC